MPFQMMVPSKSISSSTTGGGWVSSAVGGVACGMSIFTAWVWIGMVMISITSSTSIRSISGVELTSIITYGSLRSDERRLGTEVVRTLRLTWSPYLYTK